MYSGTGAVRVPGRGSGPNYTQPSHPQTRHSSSPFIFTLSCGERSCEKKISFVPSFWAVDQVLSHISIWSLLGMNLVLFT